MSILKLLLQNIETKEDDATNNAKTGTLIENGVVIYKDKFTSDMYEIIKHAKKLHKLIKSFTNDKIKITNNNDTVGQEIFEKIGKYLYFYINTECDDNKTEETKVEISFEPEIQIENKLHILVNVWKQYYHTISSPTNKMGIDQFIEKVHECIKSLNLQERVKCEVIDCNSDSKFQAIYAVGKASANNRPRMLVTKLGLPPYTFATLGKGVMYDTGGLSLKPSKHMEGMHQDMGGGALAIFSTLLSYLRTKQSCICVVPLVENCIGSDAYRVGDIIDTYSGKKIEVTNTDAEGRIILADGLSYIIDKFETLKFIVTFATLTGALEVTFGKEYAAVLADSRYMPEIARKVKDTIKQAKTQYGEYIGELPSDAIFGEALKSQKTGANIKNTTQGYGAGTITAYKFIEYFHTAKNILLVHFDIANYYERSLVAGNSATSMLELATDLYPIILAQLST